MDQTEDDPAYVGALEELQLRAWHVLHSSGVCQLLQGHEQAKLHNAIFRELHWVRFGEEGVMSGLRTTAVS